MQIFGKLRIVAPFKSEFKLTLGYLNPALNNPTLSMKIANLPDIQLSTCFFLFSSFYFTSLSRYNLLVPRITSI